MIARDDPGDLQYSTGLLCQTGNLEADEAACPPEKS